MPNIYKRLFEKVKTEISLQHKIALTTDVWTTEHSTFSVLSITAHFICMNTITKEFEPNVRVIGLIKMKGSHTGEQIKNKLESGIQSMEIDKVL